jgi:hypothetical protein
MATMQRSIITAVLVLALVALCAAIVPLSTQQVSASSYPALAHALFHCRTQQGIDQTCAALTQALITEQRKHDVTVASDRTCRADPRISPQSQKLIHERSPALE